MSPNPPVALVLLDLDGTLLATEHIVARATASVLAAHGATLPPAAVAASLGRRPRDAWAAVAAALAEAGTPLPAGVDAYALLAQSEALLKAQWASAPPLPGAVRLFAHLLPLAPAVRVGLVTSTPAPTLATKTGPGAAGAPFGRERFTGPVVCGDDARVAAGKPAPDAFTLAAAEAGVPPASCLVIEDSPAGVAAALAAGMRCVCVPSVPDAPLPAAADAADGRLAVLPSLLEFDPAAYGLPPFADAVAGAVPLAHPAPFASVGGGGVVFLDGTVVRGAGRGSAQLGIPTANLDAATLDAALAGAVMGGIYAAFARVDDGPVYPSAVSVGFNPHFPGQRVKTAEPWILAPEGALPPSFYGSRLRLLVVAYIRGERAFASLDALIAAIHGDAAVARAALAHPALAGHAQHPELVA